MTRIDTELIRSPRPWWKDPVEIHLLLRWLADTGHILTLTEAVDFTEKPQKWAPEREEMLREEEIERLHEENAALEDEAWRDMERRSAL